MTIKINQLDFQSVDSHDGTGFATDYELQQVEKLIKNILIDGEKIDFDKIEFPEDFSAENIKEAVDIANKLEGLITENAMKEVQFLEEVESVDDVKIPEHGMVVRERETNSFKYYNGKGPDPGWITVSSGLINKADDTRDGLLDKKYYKPLVKLSQSATKAELISDIRFTTDMLHDGVKSKVLTNELRNKINNALQPGAKNIPYTTITFEGSDKMFYSKGINSNLTRDITNNTKKIDRVIGSGILEKSKVEILEEVNDANELLGIQEKISKRVKDDDDKAVIVWVRSTLSYYIFDSEDYEVRVQDGEILNLPILSIPLANEHTDGVLGKEDYANIALIKEFFKLTDIIGEDGKLDEENIKYKLVKDAGVDKTGYHYVAGSKGKHTVVHYKFTNEGLYRIKEGLLTRGNDLVEDIIPRELVTTNDPVHNSNLVAGDYEIHYRVPELDIDVVSDVFTINLDTNAFNKFVSELRKIIQSNTGYKDGYDIQSKGAFEVTTQPSKGIITLTSSSKLKLTPEVTLVALKNTVNDTETGPFTAVTERNGRKALHHGLDVHFNFNAAPDKIRKFKFIVGVRIPGNGGNLTQSEIEFSGYNSESGNSALLAFIANKINNTSFEFNENIPLSSTDKGYLLAASYSGDTLTINSKVPGIIIDFQVVEMETNTVDLSYNHYVFDNIRNNLHDKEEVSTESLEDRVFGQCESTVITINHPLTHTETFLIKYSAIIRNPMLEGLDPDDVLPEYNLYTKTKDVRRLVVTVDKNDSVQTIARLFQSVINASNDVDPTIPGHSDKLMATVSGSTITVSTKNVPSNDRIPTIEFVPLAAGITFEEADIEGYERIEGIDEKENYWEEPLKVNNRDHGDVTADDILAVLDRETMLREIDNVNDFFTRLYSGIIRKELENSQGPITIQEFDEINAKFVQLFEELEGAILDTDKGTVSERLEDIEKVLKDGVNPEGQIKVTNLRFSGENIEPTTLVFDNVEEFRDITMDKDLYTATVSVTGESKGDIGEYWVEKHDDKVMVHNTGFSDTTFDLTITFPMSAKRVD